MHGVTIPIGKGFSHARSLTLASTRSQTGLTGEDRVSRLPAPLPFGSDALREQAERDVSEARTSSDPGPTIRFHLEGPEGAEANGKRKNEGILSNPSTPSRANSRPSTPPHTKRGGLGVAVGHDQDRETPRMQRRGESWQEGTHTVIESEDGETVRVVSRPQE